MLGVQPVHAQHTSTGVRANHVYAVLARHDRYAVQRPEDVQRQIAAGHAARDAGHLSDIGRFFVEFKVVDLRGNCGFPEGVWDFVYESRNENKNAHN